MAIYGSLKTMDIGDVLQWLYLRNKTGVLTLKIGEYEKKLIIKEGKIKYGFSENPAERLGSFLIKFAGLTKEELENALKKSYEESTMLGESLIKTGKLTREDLEKILNLLVKEIVYNCFTTEEGYFRFEEREENVPFEVELEIQEMLLEGYARKDEIQEIKTIIPNLEIRFLVKVDPSKDEFLMLLDLGKTLKEVADELQMVEFDALKKAHEYIEKGYIEPLEQIVYGEKKKEKEKDSYIKIKGEADFFFKEGRLKEALSLYRKILEIDPSNEDIKNKIKTIERALEIKDLSDNSIPKLKLSPSDLQNLELSPQEGFVLSRINGIWSIEQISKVCPFPPETTKGIIKILYSRGIIEI